MTLVELLVALAIFGVVLATMTGLFVSGLSTEVDQSQRVEAQQEARLALDQMRRELRCARSVTPDETSVTSGSPDWPRSSISVVLGSYCRTNTTGSPLTVTYCTEQVGGVERYRLKRYAGAPASCSAPGARVLADRITKGTDLAVLPASPLRTILSGQIFRGYSKTIGERGSVRLAIPVNADPGGAAAWCGHGLPRCTTLRAEVVLRNTAR